MITIVPAYAAIFGLLMIGFAMRVIRERRLTGVPLGHGTAPNLERAIRAHGNYAEYVPLTLLLLAFVELAGNQPWVVHGLCLVLLSGRVVHAIGISRAPENYFFRTAGMALTFATLSIASVILLAGGSAVTNFIATLL